MSKNPEATVWTDWECHGSFANQKLATACGNLSAYPYNSNGEHGVDEQWRAES